MCVRLASVLAEEIERGMEIKAADAMVLIPRLLNPPHDYSFFLFGPRGSGKSTFLRQRFVPQQYYWVDLLDKKLRRRYDDDPMQLRNDWEKNATATQKQNNWIIIDEVQEVPDLLNTVHQCMELQRINFVLTGSSSRKLRRAGANMLAGRALLYHLHPFSAQELGEQFDLDDALRFGTLPRAWQMRADPEARKEILNDYVRAYLREEIVKEKEVHELEPFRNFLRVAAESSGTVINVKRMAKQANVDTSSVNYYYQLLEDTLLGFYLSGYSRKARVVQANNPKFYLCDIGIMRAAAGWLDKELTPSTSAYGRAFEHFVILEVIKAQSISRQRFDFSYLKTSNGNDSEIDLIARGGDKQYAIEIKSTPTPTQQTVRNFARLCASLKDFKPYIFCRAEEAYTYEGVSVLPWQQGVQQLFG